MSQENGVSPQSSIGSSPQPSMTQATISNSHPSPSILKHSPPDTRASPKPLPNSKQSSAPVSKQVHIPRLSPATTELLARVTGNIQGEKRDNNDLKDKSPNNIEYYFIGGRTGGSNKMRVSSTFIDLPIPPFASKTPSDTPRRAGTPQQEDVSQSADLNGISPKPVEEQPNSAPQTQAQIQSRATSPPSSTTKWHELPSIRPAPSKENSSELSGMVRTSPKAAGVSSTSVSQTQSQSQLRATSSASRIVERESVPDMTPKPPKEEKFGPSELARTSPKPIATESVSDPQVQTQSESQATSSASTAEQTPVVPFSTSEGNNLGQASKPAGTPPISLLQAQQPQLQDIAPIAQSKSPAITAERPRGPINPSTFPKSDNTRTTGPIPIAPKPVETQAPVAQAQPQVQARAPQTVHSAAFTPEQTTLFISSTCPKESNLRSSTLVPIAPRPTEGPTSLPQIQPQLQDAAPATQAATSQIPLTLPPKAPSASRQRKSTTNAKRGKKRKRGDDSDNEVIRAGDSSSDESDVAPTATQTKSGRQVTRPSLYVPPTTMPTASKAAVNSPNASNRMTAPATSARKRRRPIGKGKDINVSCVHCQRGHSPLTNVIVFCDECNGAWHQLCHDPPIDNEVVTVQEKEWRCRGCKPVPITIAFPTVVRSNPALQSRPLGPPAHPPLPVSQIEVGGEGYSRDERRGYLSSLSHATLVELLVTLSDHHPSVPMFPADLRSLPTSRFVHQSSTPTVPPAGSAATSTTSGSTVPPANSSSSEQEASQTSVYSAPNPLPAPAARRGRYDESSDESEYEEVEDHRLYPRAGNGYRLSLDPNDLDILQEDPACLTFSYALHGPAKARAEANEAAPVWGAA